MFVVTQATLLLNNDQVADTDQRVILNEMVRFLTHPSAGVKSFDQMPASWTDLVGKVQAGGKISLNSPEAKEVVGAWHQEVRDLSLILSRQLSTQVATRISRAHAADPALRLKAGIAELVDRQYLMSTLLVPAAAAPIDICVDLQKRSVTTSMNCVGQYLKAWQPSTPRIREERSTQEAVAPEAASQDAEAATEEL